MGNVSASHALKLKQKNAFMTLVNAAKHFPRTNCLRSFNRLTSFCGAARKRIQINSCS